jgi:hypothetical protein
MRTFRKIKRIINEISHQDNRMNESLGSSNAKSGFDTQVVLGSMEGLGPNVLIKKVESVTKISVKG